jgi:hypothetical protein
MRSDRDIYGCDREARILFFKRERNVREDTRAL